VKFPAELGRSQLLDTTRLNTRRKCEPEVNIWPAAVPVYDKWKPWQFIVKKMRLLPQRSSSLWTRGGAACAPRRFAGRVRFGRHVDVVAGCCEASYIVHPAVGVDVSEGEIERTAETTAAAVVVT